MLFTGLLNATLSSGEYLINGHQITCFTNEEEKIVEEEYYYERKEDLEVKLEKNGATLVKKGPFKANVVIDGRLITGQNPQSASPIGDAIVEALTE